MRLDDNWPEDTRALLPEGNYLVTSLDRRYPYEELYQFDFIASCTTGTDHIDNRGIPLISLKGESVLDDVYATAEHTWALILSLIRKVPWAFDDVKQGYWEREDWQGTELRGKTLAIVGYGRVGQQVAEIAEAFGMKVIASDVPSSRHDAPYRHHKVEFCIFETLLKNADIVTVHVPLTTQTEKMFGIEQFALMQSTAYFVNTSRGAVVDITALLDALDNGQIAGAALDVLGGEPRPIIPRRHNLLITPHLGGNTLESRRKTQAYLAQRIKDFIGGANDVP